MSEYYNAEGVLSKRDLDQPLTVTPAKMTQKMLGRALAHLVPLGLQVWAAVETDGVLRWSLVVWIAFVVSCYAFRVAGWDPER